MQRPIVDFSLENRAALKAKEKRMQKSKEVLNEKLKSTDSEATDKTKKKRKKPKRKLIRAPTSDAKCTSINKNNKKKTKDSDIEYSGLKSKPGISTLPRMKPKGKITPNIVKTKKKGKMSRKEKAAAVQKNNSKSKEDKLDKMIAKRKKMVEKSDSVNIKKKWYNQ